jgi:hypothetical protein
MSCNNLPSEYLNLRGRKGQEAEEDYVMKNFINCIISPNIIRVTKSSRRWARHVAYMGEMRNAYKIMVEKPEGKKITQTI